MFTVAVVVIVIINTTDGCIHFFPPHIPNCWYKFNLWSHKSCKLEMDSLDPQYTMLWLAMSESTNFYLLDENELKVCLFVFHTNNCLGVFSFGNYIIHELTNQPKQRTLHLSVSDFIFFILDHWYRLSRHIWFLILSSGPLYSLPIICHPAMQIVTSSIPSSKLLIKNIEQERDNDKDCQHAQNTTF